MKFEPGQKVIYVKNRCGADMTTELHCIYVEEVQFSHKERRHKIRLLNGRYRFVGLYALIDAEDRKVWPFLTRAEYYGLQTRADS
jgi:hypothetical protein